MHHAIKAASFGLQAGLREDILLRRVRKTMASDVFLDKPISWVAKIINLPTTPPRGYFGQLLLMVIVFEASLLGSGRLLTLGPLTVKMLLYLVSLCYVASRMISGDRFHASTLIILLAFATIGIAQTVLGLVLRNDADVMLQDLRWLAYFPALLFFDRTIRSLRTLESISRIIRIAAVVMCIGFALLLFLVMTGRVSLSTLFELSLKAYGDEVGDFMLGGGGGSSPRVFYKGFLYVGIGAFFWIVRPGWRAKVVAILLLCVLAATGTRGFTLAAIGCLILLAISVDRNKVRALVVAGLLLVATVSLATVYVSFFRNSQDTSDSDETRLITAREVQERTTPASVLFGHGLGSGVPMRPVHMEMTYMEIFYKQGLLGLAVWGGTFAFIVRRYLSLKNSRFEVLATPYFISVVFVGIQSVANAFINNPIGLSMVFVSLSALEFLHSQLADGGTALRHPVSAKT
jgi:hypothetical protein